MQKNVKRTLAAVLSLALTAGSLAAVPADADAAAKPKLAKKSVTVKAGKSVKVKIKNVKAKQVKKLTVKTSKKAIATATANGKTALTVKGKKAGKATVTASVKVGKKTTKLKLSVTVTGSGPAQTAAPSSAPSAVPTQAPSDPTQTPPTETKVPKPTPMAEYMEDFENGLGDWYARGNDWSKENPDWKPEWEDWEGELKLTLSDESNGNGSHSARIDGRDGADGQGHEWNGPAIDMTDRIAPGGKYRATFYAKVPNDATTYKKNGVDIMLSGATAYSEDEETYENYPRDTWHKIRIDDWTKISVEFTVPEYFYSYILYVETHGFAKAPFLIDDFHLELIAAPAEYDATLPSIREAYAPYIPVMGVAVNYGQLMNQDTLAFIKHHFNSVTMGNEMKLDNMLATEETLTLAEAEAAGYVISDAYKACEDNKDAEGNIVVPEISFAQMDRILKQAKDNGLKMRVHSPFWHSQMPQHFFTKSFATYSDSPKTPGEFANRYTDKETMYTREEMYVQTLLKHIVDGGYEDTVSAYDVVNEYLHMIFKSTNDKYTNYWECIFGARDVASPYVKKAFVAAHEELVKLGVRDKIALMYNDFSTYDEVDDVIALINNINAKDDMNPDGAKVCNGIGMQSHVGMDTGMDKYRAAIEAFTAQGFEIQITELDVASGNVTSETSQADKDKIWARNAEKYGELMKVVLEEKTKGANITSVTVWGITDASSWIADSAPLLFGETVADKKPSFDAFVDAALNYKP